MPLMKNRTFAGAVALAVGLAPGLGCSSKGGATSSADAGKDGGAPASDAGGDTGGQMIACRVAMDDALDPCGATSVEQETRYQGTEFADVSGCWGGGTIYQTRTADHAWDCSYGGDGKLVAWDRIESTSLCGGRASAVVADLYSQGQLMSCLPTDGSAWTWVLGFDPGPPTVAIDLAAANIGATNTISFGMDFVLGGTEVAGADLSFRYWYTADGTAGAPPPQSISCTGSNGIGCDAASVLFTLVPVSPPRPTADTYLEISFPPSTGVISTGFDLSLGLAITRTDGALYDQSNDYSYNGAADRTPTAKVTAYVKGTLIYGTEP